MQSLSFVQVDSSDDTLDTLQRRTRRPLSPTQQIDHELDTYFTACQPSGRALRRLTWTPSSKAGLRPLQFARPRNDAPLSDDNQEVESVLHTISAYERGVLSLYHTVRAWPAPLLKRLGRYTAIAIRLDCADHPAVGSTPTLEQRAAERLTASLTDEGPLSARILDLYCRAVEHHADAAEAYFKARAARV
jgi:hypothetical protein